MSDNIKPIEWEFDDDDATYLTDIIGVGLSNRCTLAIYRYGCSDWLEFNAKTPEKAKKAYAEIKEALKAARGK